MGLLEKYQLGEVLCEGEARTCKGRDIASGREVLVHQLTGGSDRTRGTDLVRMIHRLLRNLPPGSHNPILDLGEHNGVMCLVTEVIPGFVSVRAWLEQQIEPGKSRPAEQNAPGARPVPLAPPAEATVVASAPVELRAGTDRADTAPPAQKAAAPQWPPQVSPDAPTMIVAAPAAAAPGGSMADAAEKTRALQVPAAALEPEPAGLDGRTAIGIPAAGGLGLASAPLPAASAVPPAEIDAAMKTTVMAAPPAEPTATAAMEIPVLRAQPAATEEVRTTATPESVTPGLSGPPATISPAAAPPAPKPAAPAGEFTRVFQGLGVPVTFRRPTAPPVPPTPAPAEPPAARSGEFTRFLQASPAAPPSVTARDIQPPAARDTSGGEFAKIFGSSPDTFSTPSGLGLETAAAPPPFERQQPGEFTRIFGGAAAPRPNLDPAPAPQEVPRDSGQAPAGIPAPPGAVPETAAAPGAGKGAAPPRPELPLAVTLPPKPAVPKMPPPPPVQLPKPPVFAAPAAPKMPPPAPAVQLKAPAMPAKAPAVRKSYLPLIIVLGCVLAAAAGLILYFALHH